MELKEYSTKELVDELKQREGVETTIAEPYHNVGIMVSGPAVVLVVSD